MMCEGGHVYIMLPVPVKLNPSVIKPSFPLSPLVTAMIRFVTYAIVFAVAANPAPLDDAKIPALSAYGMEEMVVSSEYGTLSKKEWTAKLAAQGWLLKRPEMDHDFLNFTPPAEPLPKRDDCEAVAYQQLGKPARFVDWDVQMSPILCGGGLMDLSVAEGYTISNTLGFSGSFMPSGLKGQLGALLGVDFSRTWTTTNVRTVTGHVINGQCGCMIYMPLVTRYYGRVLRGCVGVMTEVGRYMVTQHASASYEGFEWVSGAISVCNRTQSYPPLQRCHGGGFLV